MIIHRIESTSKEVRVFSFNSDTGIVKPQKLDIPVSEAENYLRMNRVISDDDRVIIADKIPGAFSAPFKIYIDITDSCQLNCMHCLTKKLNLGHEISINNLEAISNECYEMGVFYIKLGGGEPLLHKDFPHILKLFRKSGQFISMSTNGYLVDDLVANLLYANKVKTTVSIEGPERIDSAIRGTGHYEIAIKALNTLKRHNVNVCLRVTLTKKILDINIIKELIQIAEANDTKIKFSYCRPAGSSIDNELLLDYSDKKRYHEVISFLNEKMNEGIAVLDEGMMIKQPQDLYMMMYDERICGCTNKSMHINSQCQFSPCVFLGTDYIFESQYVKGNIKKYWQGLIDERVKKIRNIPFPTSCEGCDRLCKYECLATRLYFNHNPNVSDPNCLRYMA